MWPLQYISFNIKPKRPMLLVKKTLPIYFLSILFFSCGVSKEMTERNKKDELIKWVIKTDTVQRVDKRFIHLSDISEFLLTKKNSSKKIPDGLDILNSDLTHNDSLALNTSLAQQRDTVSSDLLQGKSFIIRLDRSSSTVPYGAPSHIRFSDPVYLRSENLYLMIHQYVCESLCSQTDIKVYKKVRGGFKEIKSFTIRVS